MFVFVITAPSAVVELQLFNDVVKDGLLMCFWCLFGDILSQLYFHVLETIHFTFQHYSPYCYTRDVLDCVVAVFLRCKIRDALGLVLLIVLWLFQPQTHRVEVIPACCRKIAIHIPGPLSVTKSVNQKSESKEIIQKYRLLYQKLFESCMCDICIIEQCVRTWSRAGVISRAGPQRNCLQMFHVVLSFTNLGHTNTDPH